MLDLSLNFESITDAPWIYFTSGLYENR